MYCIFIPHCCIFRNHFKNYLNSRSPSWRNPINHQKSWKRTWTGPNQKTPWSHCHRTSGSVALTWLQRPGSSRWTSSEEQSSRQSLQGTATLLIAWIKSSPSLRTAKVGWCFVTSLTLVIHGHIYVLFKTESTKQHFPCVTVQPW